VPIIKKKSSFFDKKGRKVLKGKNCREDEKDLKTPPPLGKNEGVFRRS